MRLLLVGLLLLPFAPEAVASSVGRSLDGHWEGIYVVRPADLEVDLVLDFAVDGIGKRVGLIVFPTYDPHPAPLTKIEEKGSQVSFEYWEGERSWKFSGQLSEDGDHITGKVRDKDNLFPFTFDRKPMPKDAGRSMASASLRHLSADDRELKDLFNADVRKVRLVVCLSPTCPNCAIAARVVQRHVLDRITDPRLRMYVVWGPMLGDETEEAARLAMAHLPDPRVTHFWTTSKCVPTVLREQLASYPAWEVFFLYPAGTTWKEIPPHPSFYVHKNSMKMLPEDRRFNGDLLLEQARRLLKQTASH